MEQEQTSRSDGPQASRALDTIPVAKVHRIEELSRRRWRTRLWWLTAFCAVAAAVLVVNSWRRQGTTIAIEFLQGHGIKPGDALRYRGVDVGQVETVMIGDDLRQVVVEITLFPGNERIAVEGSQFWIARPRIRLGQMSGLETVVGAKYVAVMPGPDDAPPQKRFEGRESPLLMTDGEYTEIRIRFPAGEGIEIGDPVRYRGIAVGEVTEVQLDAAAQHVLVDVRLFGAARNLARTGTQFWIERPRLDLTEIRGLETLVAGRFIALEPASADSAPQMEFVGLPSPPPLPRSEGSLELELDAPRRFGLVRGAPVRYREVEVGRVANVRIADDAASVKIFVVIDPKYAVLVRHNSKWWAVSGVQVDAGLQGVHIAIDSLSAWIRGGIAFATPPNPGKRVLPGHRFVLEPAPLAEWLDWKPRIDLSRAGELGFELPRPVLLTAQWTSKWLGLPRTRSAEGWGVPLADGRLVFPRNLAIPEEGIIAELLLAGERLTGEAVEEDARQKLAWVPLPDSIDATPWPMAKIADAWDAPSTLLVVNPEVDEPMPLDASRIAVEEERIRLAPGVTFAERLQGSPVVDAGNGTLIGILVIGNEGWEVCPVSPRPPQP
ncbi:MAG: hypothetical protein KatS3mg111_3246 [Pirellulaceae bacterium]|nr:MAG: hypothetical protein KatS3mg111_3246 [Pirellulaceae bacterium]